MSDPGHGDVDAPLQPLPGIDYPDPYQRASMSVWASGVAWIVLAGCCSASIVAVSLLPISELRAQDNTGEIPEETWEQFAQLQSQPGMAGFLTVFVTLTLLPGVALLVLGFFVNRRSRGAALGSLIITYAMAGIVGLLTLMGVISVLSGQFASLVTLLPILAALLLYVWSIGNLRKARSEPDVPPTELPPGYDPWEHTL